MVKSKKTPVPLPGSKPKSQMKEASSKKPLSNEFVDESSDESSTELPVRSKKEKKTTKEKAPVTIAVHNPKANGAAKKTKTPVPAPKKAVKEASVAASSSSEESSGEEESTESPKEKAKKDTSGGASSSSSESESESDSEDEAAPAPTPSRAQTQPQQSQSHTVDFRPVQAFVPPKGYVAMSTPLDAPSHAAKLFENLEGKQIWHITAPAGVSIAQLKEVAMDRALSGEAVLNHKGTDYGFTTADENEAGEREVLLPRSNGYKAVPARIAKTLHLQEVLRLPKLPGTEEENPAPAQVESITRSCVRAPREQLKGLRMRYFHSGFGDQEPGTLGASDSEGEAPAATKSQRKRKLEEQGADSATKKHKKHKTPEEIKKRELKKAKKDKEKTKSK